MRSLLSSFASYHIYVANFETVFINDNNWQTIVTFKPIRHGSWTTIVLLRYSPYVFDYNMGIAHQCQGWMFIHPCAHFLQKEEEHLEQIGHSLVLWSDTDLEGPALVILVYKLQWTIIINNFPFWNRKRGLSPSKKKNESLYGTGFLVLVPKLLYQPKAQIFHFQIPAQLTQFNITVNSRNGESGEKNTRQKEMKCSICF